MRTVVIFDACRTPIGGFQGDLFGASAVLRRGVAAICIGGGEGTAIAIERP